MIRAAGPKLTVSSDHIHLLVYDSGKREMISMPMQLIAGRTAREYNQKKERKVIFTAHRYLETAVLTNKRLASCLINIDLYGRPRPVRWAWRL